MKLSIRIILIWLALVVTGVAALLLFPHRAEADVTSSALQAITLLVGVIAYYIFRREPNPKNKPIFLNFAILFGTQILFYVYMFIGKAILVDSPYASFYFFQYIPSGFYYLFLSYAIVYVVVDSLFYDLKSLQKYAVTFLIVGGVFTYYYHPILTNPKFLYTTSDIVDYKAVSTVARDLKQNGVQDPTAEEIAASITLHAWKDGGKVGTLFEGHKLLRVTELMPYLEANNWMVLLYRPLYLNVIYMNVFSIVFIFLFFGYQYKKDPPQGAYVEKILFLFLPYCSLETLHYFAYYNAVEQSALLEVHHIGQYLTIFVTLLFLVFFSLRLRFITSVKGEFYEQELVSDSEHISRWRDGVDNFIVHHFLNPKTLHGRLLAPRTPRGET